MATQLKRPEVWEKMDEEIAKRADEEKIKNGEVFEEHEVTDGMTKGEDEVVYLEK